MRKSGLTLVERKTAVVEKPQPLSDLSFFLPQERLVQSTIHGDDLSGRLGQTLRDQKKIRFRLICRRNRRFRERAVGLKLREFFHE